MLLTVDELRASNVETDMSDPALQAYIQDATAEIEKRYGPVAAITVTRFVGDLSLSNPTTIYLERPAATITSVTEFWGDPLYEVSVTLDPTDYRVHYGGRALERIGTGVNKRWTWGHRVTVVYTPVDDSAQRRRVCIDLVKLALRFTGTKEIVAGNTREYTYDSYSQERANLLDELSLAVAFS